MNKITITGRLTKDPEFKATSTGTSVANFSIANNAKRGERERTTFLDCVAFGKLADIVNSYLTKGRKILIEGEIVQENWDDKEGKKHSKLKIYVNSFEFMDSKSNGESSNSQGSNNTGKPKSKTISHEEDEFSSDSDLPF